MQEISRAIVEGSLDAIKEDSKEKMERLMEIKRDHGKNARQVEPYAPNRKQLRAQKASKRKQKAKSR